jgi:hypothetical protein
VLFAHVLLKPYFPVEVLSSLACVAVLYPLLRLIVFRPKWGTEPSG